MALTSLSKRKNFLKVSIDRQRVDQFVLDFFGISKESGAQNFAYLKSGEVLPYAKHQEEFAKQGFEFRVN